MWPDLPGNAWGHHLCDRMGSRGGTSREEDAQICWCTLTSHVCAQCTHTCTHRNTHIHMDTHMHTCKYMLRVHMYTQVMHRHKEHACKHVHTSIYIHVCTQIHACTHRCTHADTCAEVHTQIYICIQGHVHTGIHSTYVCTWTQAHICTHVHTDTLRHTHRCRHSHKVCGVCTSIQCTDS